MTNIDTSTGATGSGVEPARTTPATATPRATRTIPEVRYWNPAVLARLLRDGLRHGDAAAIQKLFDRHGDVVGLTLPPGVDIVGVRKIVLFRDPQLIKPLFVAPPEVVDATQANRVAELLYGDRSMFLIDGPDHKRLRKLVLPRLRGNELNKWGAELQLTVRSEIEQWFDKPSISVHPRMGDVALQSILNITLGVTGDRWPTWHKAMHDIFALPTIVAMAVRYPFRNFGAFRWWRSYNRRLAAADALIYGEITHRRATPEVLRADLLDLMMRIDGQPLTDKELRDQIVTILFAGHETNATTVTWAINFLIRNPAALAKAVAEARDDSGEDTYIEAVVNETLRLHAPAPAVGRVTRTTFDLGPYRLPPNTLVAPFIDSIHRHPALYSEPDEFQPQRFLDNKPGVYTLIPFGGGPHRCLGDRLAIFQTKLILQTILRTADLHAAGTPRTTRTILPSNGVHIHVSRAADRCAVSTTPKGVGQVRDG